MYHFIPIFFAPYDMAGMTGMSNIYKQNVCSMEDTQMLNSNISNLLICSVTVYLTIIVLSAGNTTIEGVLKYVYTF